MHRVVMANGVFDILHVGHLMYLESAREMGDRLVVTVTRNTFVNKGPNRPTNDEEDRVRLVRGLRCVDDAFLVDGAIDALQRTAPNIFVKGADYIGKIQPEHQRYCDEQGIEIRFTDTPIYSATKIINDRLRESQRLPRTAGR